MAYSLTIADHRFLAPSLAPLCLLFAFSQVGPELPPTHELIRQLEGTCNAYEKRAGTKPGLSLMELARAQAYAGDFAAAMRTAQSLSSFVKSAALVSCWEIHFQLTGEVAELPADAFRESDSEKADSTSVRVEIAKVLVKSGRLAEATKFLPKDEENLGTALILVGFHLLLAKNHAQRGDRQQAARSLQRAWTLVQRLPDYGKMERIEAIGKLWLQLGDRPQALAAQDAAVKRLRDRSTKEKPNKSLALDWARAGKLQALLGQDDLAREAFREALRQAHAVDQTPKDEDFRDEDLRADDYIETVGQIGAWQFAAGAKSEAAESYGKAIARVRTIKDKKDRHRDYRLLQLLQLQSNEGDSEGALKTLECMEGPYWKGLGYCQCASKLTSGVQPPAVQQLLDKAEELADAESKPTNRADLWVKIAEVKAKANDLPGTKRCLEKAIKASQATKAKDSHQVIARCQVRVGLLDDAYETIRAIPQLEWRVLPLAELTREVAKRQALTRKDTK